MAGPAGASTLETGPRSRLAAWLGHHRSVAVKSLLEMLTAWVSSLMTWLVIGIAFALPLILYLLLVNVGDVSAAWEGKPRLSAYLEDSVDEAEGRRFTFEAASLPEIRSATYISREEALEEFKALSGFGEVLASLPANPLPAVVELEVAEREPAALGALVARLEKDRRVESVSLDLAWIERLFALLALGERFVAALAFFLALGVLLSIGNTIRLAIENRRAEIEVVKLVGGTDAFVRRPFLYLGFWYGLGGALAAFLLVEVSLLLLAGPVDRLVRSYDNSFSLIGMQLTSSLALFSGGALLGVLGAALAVRRHLHDIEPQ